MFLQDLEYLRVETLCWNRNIVAAKIAFFRTEAYERETFEKANKAFQLDLQYIQEPLSLDTASLAKGCKAICIFVNDAIDEKLIEHLYTLGVRLIALRGAGFDKIDLKAAQNKIKVVRVPEYSPYAVAEYAVGLMLTLNRKYHHAYDRTKSHNFSISGFLGFDMHQKVVGVIGVGRIGAVVVHILQGFGMRVLAYDVDPVQVKKTKAQLVDLPTLYKESDIITLHAPLTKENHYLIDRKAIFQMKRNVLIINTGRGGLINTKDLIEGLEMGKVGGAALDVYENEKEIFYKDLSQKNLSDPLLERLLEFPQVLVTSHMAYFTEEATSNIAKTTLENIQDFLEDKPLKNKVEFAAG